MGGGWKNFEEHYCFEPPVSKNIHLIDPASTGPEGCEEHVIGNWRHEILICSSRMISEIISNSSLESSTCK